MSYSWEETKQAVERVEEARLAHELEQAETARGIGKRSAYPLQRAGPFLEVTGALVLGAYVAVFVLIANFMVFVWLLHVNFDF